MVIPFYKAEQYFEECLRSITGQTLRPDQIIVVNDSPSPQSIEFLARFAGQCEVVTLPVNGGVAGARNAGVRTATQPWIAFMDADDVWEQDKLEKQMQFLREHPEYDACHTGVKTFSGDKVLVTHLDKPGVLTKDDLLNSGYVMPSSFLLRKSAYEKIGGFDELMRSSEDYDLIIRLVMSGCQIAFLPLPLTGLRRENHNNLSSQWKKVLTGYCALVWKNRDYFLGHGGINKTRRFLGDRMQKCGYTCGGLKGKFVTLGGKLLVFGTRKRVH